MNNTTASTLPAWASHLDETKRGLAKLLARENITVRHEPVTTAMFDLKSRTLVLPQWSNITVDQYDLLIGHEVAHAKWSDDIAGLTAADVTPGLHTYINVLEDTRIERKIKEEFPGLRGSFRRGYADFFHNGPIFQNIGKVTLKTYSFIDRVNIHYKVGEHVEVPFTAEERTILARIDRLRTMSDAIALARELYTAEKAKQPAPPQATLKSKSKPGQQGEQGQSTSDEADAAASSEQSASAGDDASSESSESDATESDASGSSDSQDAAQPQPSQDDADGAQSDPTATTDAMNSNALQTLADLRPSDSLIQTTFGTLPDAVARAFVVSNAQYTTAVSQFFASRPTVRALAEKYLSEFRTEQGRTIKHLAAEFDRRKTAKIAEHAKVSRTGKLDVSKLHAYKFRDDLFQSAVTLPKGQSHGIVALLDASGSMQSMMADVLQQTLLFADFAKRANIPFQAYLFGVQDARMDDAQFRTVIRTAQPTQLLPDSTSVLVQILDTTAPRWNDQMVIASVLAARYDHQWTNAYYRNVLPTSADALYYLPYSRLGGGTPLAGAMLIAEHQIAVLKSSRKLDKMTLIVLTDGDNTNALETAANGSLHTAVSVRDTVTRRTYAYYEPKIAWNGGTEMVPLRNADMAMLTDAIRTRHECRVLGIRLTGGYETRRKELTVYDIESRTMRGMLTPVFGTNDRNPAAVGRTLPNAFVNTYNTEKLSVLVGDTTYMDAVLLVSSKRIALDTDAQETFDKISADAKTDRKILNAFKNANLAAKGARVFVNAVMPFIA